MKKAFVKIFERLEESYINCFKPGDYKSLPKPYMESKKVGIKVRESERNDNSK